MWFKIMIVTFLVGIATIGCGKKEPIERPKETPLQGTVEKIQWIDNLVEGLKLSKEKNKPLMVYFSADWCPPCKKMYSDVYTNLEVIKLSKNFICVKIDVDKNHHEVQKYEVRGVPTIIFFNPKGEIIERIVGYRNSEFFINIMLKFIQ